MDYSTIYLGNTSYNNLLKIISIIKILVKVGYDYNII